jgi:TolB-like protein/cytochrome c-type biogenesis protein CcmH/NrfG
VATAYLAGFFVLLEGMDIIVPMFHGPDWIIRALIVSGVVGFPIVVVLTWFYDLTPEGIRHADEVGTTEVTRFTGRNLDFVIIALLIAAVTFLLVDDLQIDDQSGHSVAVLPFANRSFDEGNAEFIAEGIQADLIVLLSKFSDIKVISSRSMERFKDTSQSLKSIADTLQVNTLVEGEVRIAGERVRINVQLVEASTGEDLWANVYERELSATNIFEIQNEVAHNVVNNLKATLLPNERNRLSVIPTDNLEAYETYLFGRRAMAKRTQEALETAVTHFRQATTLDPGFALAWVGLADAYTIQGHWGYVANDIIMPIIKQAATRAIELDDKLGEAYISLAGVYEEEGDNEAAEVAYKRALELSPGYSTAHSWYGIFLRWRTGQLEESMKHAKRAMTLDPMSAVLRMSYADNLFSLGRFEEATEQYHKSINLDGEFGGSQKMLGDMYLYTYGDAEQALNWYKAAVHTAPDPDWIGDIGQVYLTLNDTDAARYWIEQAFKSDPTNIFVNRHMSILNYYLGQDKVARDHAEQSLAGPLDLFRPIMMHIIRNHYLQHKMFDEAHALYKQYYPELFTSDPNVNSVNYRAAIDLALIMQTTGQQAQAESLLRKSLNAIEIVPRAGIFGFGTARAELLALSGNTKESMIEITDLCDEKGMRHWTLWLEKNPNLNATRTEPGYQDLIYKVNQKIKQVRRTVRFSDEI